MSTIGLGAVLGLAACTDGEPPKDRDGPPTDPTTTDTVDTDTTPTTGDTGGTVVDTTDTTDTTTTDTDTVPTHPQPTSVTASCDPTANPLRFVCHVTVDPAQPVQVAFAKSAGGTERVHTSLLEATDHDVGLYFMAKDSDYAFTASAVDWPADPVVTGTLKTGIPAGDVDSFLAVSGASSTPYLGTNLPCGSGATGGVFDTVTGELLWYEVADAGGDFGGYEMLQFTEDHTLLGQSGDQVMEIDLDGNELLRKFQGTDFAEDLHHDLYKRDGLIYLLYHLSGQALLDGFLIWDQSGTEVGRWFSGDHLYIPPSATGDWMHTNTIYVEGGFVYLSSFTQNTLLKIDADLASATFGEASWALAGSSTAGLGQDFDVDWGQVDGTDAFQHQHDLNVTADGRLILLDNSHGRGLIVSYDEVALTAVVEEAYDTTATACGPQGTATETDAGNLLVDCASLTIQEYAPGGTAPVWDASLECVNGQGGGGPSSSATRWYPLDGW